MNPAFYVDSGLCFQTKIYDSLWHLKINQPSEGYTLSEHSPYFKIVSISVG